MKKFVQRGLLSLGLCLASAAVFAAVTLYEDVNGIGITPHLMMWWNGTAAVPTSPSNPAPVTGTVTAVPLAVTPVTASTALSSNQVLKASAGTFFGANVNTSSATKYVMLFNATSLPSNGAVTPVAFWQVGSPQTLSISEIPGLSMSAGIVLGCSTTGPLTLTATIDCNFGAGAVQ